MFAKVYRHSIPIGKEHENIEDDGPDMPTPVNLASSAMIVFEELLRAGPLCPKDIASKTGLAPRTVSHALKTLMAKKLCTRTPNFSDMRSPLYHVNVEVARELRLSIDKIKAQTDHRMGPLR